MDYATLKGKVAALPVVEGEGFWQYKRRQFRRHVAEEDINRFLRWGAVGVTMYLGGWPWVEHEYRAVTTERPGWYDAIRIGSFGSPEPYHLDPATDANLVHMAYHLLQWEKATGLEVANLGSIFEFGGGYGAMASVAHKIGFRGKYTIYDLPEFSLLQEYYLSQEVPGAKVEWGKLPKKTDLFLATWSFSEMPVLERKPIIDKIDAWAYLIGYQLYFEWNDNVAWFDEWQRGKPDYTWVNQKMTHKDGDDYYLFGVKK